jgi:hypothetical protein
MIYSDGTDTRDLQTGPDLVPAMQDSEAWEALRVECQAEEVARRSPPP